MATKTKRTTTAKVDAYQVVTDRIIEALEEGIVPWQRPWKSTGLDANTPMSLATGRPYRGINVLMLLIEQMRHGYSSRYWATYNQAQARGGQVRKGEKATQVVLWKWVDVKTATGKTDDDGEPVKAGRRVPILRFYSVFNLDQIDGVTVKAETEEPVEDAPVFEGCDAAEAFVAGYQGPTLGHGGDRAYYSPGRDHVQMPEAVAFVDCDAYYSTLFHELVHSTGHEDRLNRIKHDKWGDEKYSREELVAEIGACFLCAESGVEPRYEQSAAYLKSWMIALADDKKLVVVAAAQAQKAADLILGRNKEEGVEDNG